MCGECLQESSQLKQHGESTHNLRLLQWNLRHRDLLRIVSVWYLPQGPPLRSWFEMPLTSFSSSPNHRDESLECQDCDLTFATAEVSLNCLHLPVQNTSKRPYWIFSQCNFCSVLQDEPSTLYSDKFRQPVVELFCVALTWHFGQEGKWGIRYQFRQCSFEVY